MNKVQLLRSSTPGLAPQLSELLVGELGLNLVDKRLFTNDGSAVIALNDAANVTTDSAHRFINLLCSYL